jgi:hypothetical protein
MDIVHLRRVGRKFRRIDARSSVSLQRISPDERTSKDEIALLFKGTTSPAREGTSASFTSPPPPSPTPTWPCFIWLSRWDAMSEGSLIKWWVWGGGGRMINRRCCGAFSLAPIENQHKTGGRIDFLFFFVSWKGEGARGYRLAFNEHFYPYRFANALTDLFEQTL